MSEAFSPAGRDGRVPSWLAGGTRPPENPRYDSVVVRGNGVGALTCAARLARSASLRGRVVIAAPRPVPERRLINGCTLRARSLDYLGAALGVRPGELPERLFGERVATAETRVQRFSMVREASVGRFELGPMPAWMGHDGGSPLAYGLRNGHLVELIAGELEGMGVRFTGELPGDLTSCRALAEGSEPLLVNGTPVGVPEIPREAPPARFVVASQTTLRLRSGGALARGSSALVMRRREGAFDTGVFYPFVDPLTPAADGYGILYRIVPASESLDKAAEIAAMRATVDGVADALGFDLVDAAQTRGEAMVPCLPWDDVAELRPDWLDLHRIYSACAPIITGDGMTRATLAGWVAAEAVLAGENPTPAVNRCLGTWRSTNRGMSHLMTRATRLTEPLLRRASRWMLMPVAKAPDMWASIEGGATR